MPTHAEKAFVPYTPKEMFDLVKDVRAYPLFLPWVKESKVYNELPDRFMADLTIGTHLLNHTYSSLVHIESASVYRINVSHTKGPFHHLNNHWIFNEVDGGTEIDFYLDFEINQPLLKSILSPFLNQAVSMMVSAFKERAEKLYRC
jgi:coenzyme Q-binding protein COQ10